MRSASALETSPSAAAPKITRLDSCPVAPKGARSIMRGSLRHPPSPEAFDDVGWLAGALDVPAGVAEEVVAPRVVAAGRGAAVA